MSQHRGKISWVRNTADFQYESYDRTHTVKFEGGIQIEASAAVEYLGKKELANPEELFVAALSNCHMLTFLAVAAKSRVTVNSYTDDAEGTLEKGSSGKMCVTRVVLRPKVVFADPQPDWERVEHMHEKAHANCFIANSVSTQIVLEPVR